MKTKLFFVILTLASYLFTGCVKDEVFVGDTNTDSDVALVINEVMSNQGDPNPDWIEIYNPSNSEIDMSGFGVYDKPDAIYKFAAGTMIAAKGYVVIVCDKILATSDPATYANFGISSGGETVFLVDTAAAVVDEVAVPAMPLGISYARIPDGGDVFENANGTKGTTNSNTNEPPVIEADTLVTGMINDNERFQYDVVVKDASGIASVKLWLQTATETFYFDMVPMGAGNYRLLLPLMEQGVILYYIEATDATGMKSTFKPENAAAFSLTVIDGLAVFKSVELSNENPAALEDITVTVDVMDVSGITGVKLYYLVNSEIADDKVSIDLTLNTGVWTCVIPGQNNDDVIRYYLRATDGKGLKSYYPFEEKDATGAIIGDFDHDDAATWPQITVAPFVLQLVLNEICGKQSVDDDWVEIYNTTDGEIDLNGFTIVKTDDAGVESVIYIAAVETKIASHDYFVITTIPVAGEAVLTGGISNTKNVKLELKNAANVVQSTFEKSDATTNLTGGHPTDGSYARIPNGTGDWTIQTAYTKKAANN
jgi:hypothetical protein